MYGVVVQSGLALGKRGRNASRNGIDVFQCDMQEMLESCVDWIWKRSQVVFVKVSNCQLKRQSEAE